MERLDKVLSSGGIFTRSECKKAVLKGRIQVNGKRVKSPDEKVDASVDEIIVDGERITINKFVYIMLNKPQGVVSAGENEKDKTVIDILPESFKRAGLFPAGRLDKDTVGLIIITNDGVSAHKRLSPKNHAEKVYYFETAYPYTDEEAVLLSGGVTLKDGFKTAPLKINRLSDNSGEITLTEGKYHEIKRLFGYTGNKITYLKRISFAGITLDGSLNEGDCRYLYPEEVKKFTE